LLLSVFCHRHSFGQGLAAGTQTQKIAGQTMSIYSLREFTPIRGLNKILASFSPRPKSAQEEIDKVKFPLDPKWADKVLSVKPIYLSNITTDDFKLPDPPANSSEQTRAELNYLLTLQHNRTMEDVRSSLYLSYTMKLPVMSDARLDIGSLLLPCCDGFR